MSQETIGQQPTSPEQDLAQDQQVEQQMSPEQSGELEQPVVDAQAEDALPEKFKGKSAAEIYRSYAELEKHLGKVTSERSHKEKEAEELRSKYAQLEQSYQQTLSQAMVPPPQHQMQQEVDPLADLDELLESDPKEAIKKVARRVSETDQQARYRVAMEFQAREAQSYYERQRTENPDFAALETDMQRLAKQYAPLIHPSKINSRETIEALYKLAQAENMNRYVNEAVEKARKSQEQIKEEKRRAQSESSQPVSDRSTSSAKDKSLEELQKELGYVRR